MVYLDLNKESVFISDQIGCSLEQANICLRAMGAL